MQALLGHSSIVMTLDRYGHLFPRGDDRAELAAAARAFWREMQKGLWLATEVT